MSQVKESLNEKQKVQLEKINKCIELMIEDQEIKSIVEGIESGIKTTKGNYGKYMQFLSNFNKDKVQLYIMGESLKRLGADVYGVNWAVNLLKG